MHKYPRTPHILGSRRQHGDNLDDISFSEIKGKNLIITEKCDGANCGVSFSSDGELLLQSRGHYLRGGRRERQFDLLKQWAATNQNALFDVLEDRYVMYGEWLAAKHTIFYDMLPDYLMEFDVLDTKTNEFLSEERRNALLDGLPVARVRVLHRGPVSSLDDLKNLIGPSMFYSTQRKSNFLTAAQKAGLLPTDSHFANKEIHEVLGTGDWSPLMEGLYIKWEEDGVVKGRYKFVRESFTNSVLDQNEHWASRPIVFNGISK